MRPVGVHLADEVGAVLDRDLQAFHVRPPQTRACRCDGHDHAARETRLRQRVGDRAGAIGRLIVHDHDARIGMRQDRTHQIGQVLALVVRRNDNQNFICLQSLASEAKSSRVCRLRAAAARAAARTMRTGSITGIRKRSCGKKTKQASDGGQQQQAERLRPAARRASMTRPGAAERQQQPVRDQRRGQISRGMQEYMTARSARPGRTPCVSSRPSHHTGLARDESNRLAVIDRLELFGGQPRVLGPQPLVVALDCRIRRHVAFAGRQRMVAGPERDSAFRGDQHEAPMLLIIAHRPWRNDHERPDCYQHGPPQAMPQQQPRAEQHQEEQVHRPRERGQTTDNAAGQQASSSSVGSGLGLQARGKALPGVRSPKPVAQRADQQHIAQTPAACTAIRRRRTQASTPEADRARPSMPRMVPRRRTRACRATSAIKTMANAAEHRLHHANRSEQRCADGVARATSETSSG